jgi:hypothetical protein
MESSIEGPVSGGPGRLPDTGIYRDAVFYPILFTCVVVRMNTIEDMRKIFSEFKIPYMKEHDPVNDDTNDNIQNVFNGVEDARDHINELYLIVKELIERNGNVPEDPKKRAVYRVFEKEGIFSQLKANPELKNEMLYYAKLDLYTYPFTINPNHINTLIKNNVEPSMKIVGNRVNTNNNPTNNTTNNNNPANNPANNNNPTNNN